MLLKKFQRTDRAGGRCGYQEGCSAISTELTQLEEKLLYPSNTQVSLFVVLPW
jgi:hypothetical protein